MENVVKNEFQSVQIKLIENSSPIPDQSIDQSEVQLTILTAQQVYNLLVNKHQIIGKFVTNYAETEEGLRFPLKTKDGIGSVIQEWVKDILVQYKIYFREHENTQRFPDIYLTPENEKNGLLEIKAFYDKPGFDLSNFMAYGKDLLENSYILNADYLIFEYDQDGSKIKIVNVWVKKVWEIAGGSGKYPLKVQEKFGKSIDGIRPVIWYSDRSEFKPFGTIELFLSAFDETRHQYHGTRDDNSHWLNNVISNYKEHTGIVLTIPRYKK